MKGDPWGLDHEGFPKLRCTLVPSWASSIRSILGSILVCSSPTILGDYYMKLDSNGIIEVLLPISRNHADSCVCNSEGWVGNIQAIAR